MLVKYDSRVINKLETLLTDDAGVIIYDRRMFIVQATGHGNCFPSDLNPSARIPLTES